MKIKRKFLCAGGILLIIAGIIEICTVLLGETINPLAILFFIVASVCMLIDLAKNKREK